jgi:hypothetical protein
MNDEQIKNETANRPLIFTVPACGFVVTLNVDWPDEIHSIDESVSASMDDIGPRTNMRPLWWLFF